MIPVETVLICQIESIREVSSRRDRVLGDTRHTVHMRCSTLKDAMPVYSGFDREIVRHKNLEGVVLVGFNERARMLAVDQINRAGESIGRRFSFMDSEVIGAHCCQSRRSDEAEQRETRETEHGQMQKICVDPKSPRKGEVLKMVESTS